MHSKLRDSSTRHSPERPYAHEQVLDGVAKQQSERDTRRHADASALARQLAAASELKTTSSSILKTVDLPSSSDPLLPASSNESQADPDRLVSQTGQSVQAPSAVDLLRQSEADSAASFHLASAISLAAIHGRRPLPRSDPIKSSSMDSGTSSSGNGQDLTSIAAAKYGATLHGKPDTAAPAQGPVDIPTELAARRRDHSSTKRSRAQPETDVDAHDGRDDRPRDNRGATDLGTILQPSRRAQDNEASILERATDRDTAPFSLNSAFHAASNLPSQGNRSSLPLGVETTIGRNDERHRDDGRSPGVATGGAVESALTDATDELERLRVAVGRTIDEMERVRGIVQAPLPALPPNRGAFRIS